jgi:hypothetical protein
MPFADKVVHVTISGDMFSGQEEWQTGFYMGLAEGAAAVPNQGFADAVRDAWLTLWTAPVNGFASAYRFNQVKAVRLGTDGKYDGSDIVTSTPASATAGGGSGSPLPPQCALVATLIAGSGKGLAGKGRMYLPGLRVPIDSSGGITTTAAQTTADFMAAFLNTVNGSFDAPGVVINASKGGKAALYTNPRNVPVNGVRVGTIYDTQRRRRNGMAELYSNAVVNP